MDVNRPLELQLVDALLADDHERARRIAGQLYGRGFDMAVIEEALRASPQLEQQLYAVLYEVVPLARRAAKRRAIRAAEERDWAGWSEGKREEQ